MMTTTKNSKRKNQPNGVDINQFPKLGAAIDEAVASGLLNGVEGAKSLTHMVMKRFVEAALQGEMQAHLDGIPSRATEGGDQEAEEVTGTRSQGNKRNGVGRKTINTDVGPVEINVPRDRQGTFSPILLPKHARQFSGFDDKIIAMYARGMSTRDISAFLEEQYGIGVSAEYVSTVTDRVLEDVEAWQSRPLNSMYPVVFFDAMRVKIRSGMVVKPMAVHIALGIASDGSRDVLGMWIAENEGASFWASVFNNLKTRGVEDILIAVTDGLKGMTEALEVVFPRTEHQTCIVHLIRSSTAFISHRDRKAVCDGLKPVYQATDAVEAERALEVFAESPMGKRYPAVAEAWRRAWAQVIPFFRFPPAIRRLIYTTNSIEGLNRAVRKVIKTRTLFPNEEAAKKLIYLAIRNFTEGWKRPTIRWSNAMPEFALLYGERFTDAAE